MLVLAARVCVHARINRVRERGARIQRGLAIR